MVWEGVCSRQCLSYLDWDSVWFINCYLFLAQLQVVFLYFFLQRMIENLFSRYSDYRERPGSPNEYEKSSVYWQIIAAKLAFVVIFENVVVLVMIIVKWCIPDVPVELRDQIRREAYITNEIIIHQESLRAQSGKLRKYCLRYNRWLLIMCWKDFLEVLIYSCRYFADVSPKKLEKLRNINEAPASPEQWDRLISKSLSGSEFEVLVDSEQPQNSGPNTPSSV